MKRVTKRIINYKNKSKKQKYAAGVPHVMIYPDSGLIKYRSVNEIILKNTRFR